MMRIFTVILVCSLFAGAALPVHAQSSAMADRLNRLERDLNFLQRQVYRNDTKLPAGSSPTATASTQTLSEIARLQEEIRKIRGSVERSNFKTRQLADEYKRFSQDVDFRLQALEEAERKRKNPDSGETRFSIDEGKEAGSARFIDSTGKPGEDAKNETVTPAKAAQSDATSANAARAEQEAVFNSADAHYNTAFAMLNNKQYAEAAENFSAFIRKYPNDPLVANAYYWLGESYFAREDYVRATEQFRKGYEVAPAGQKAADNLLKLGISLANVKRKEEACIVLQQVVTKFKTAATAATNARASETRASLQCK